MWHNKEDVIASLVLSLRTCDMLLRWLLPVIDPHPEAVYVMYKDGSVTWLDSRLAQGLVSITPPGTTTQRPSVCDSYGREGF